jgi:hypothetical protein
LQPAYFFIAGGVSRTALSLICFQTGTGAEYPVKKGKEYETCYKHVPADRCLYCDHNADCLYHRRICGKSTGTGNQDYGQEI